MRPLLWMAIASLATTAAFGQSTAPEGSPPKDQPSSSNSGSSSSTGVAVDVGSLVKGLVKAVRKPAPKPAPAVATAPPENPPAATTEPAQASQGAVAMPPASQLSPTVESASASAIPTTESVAQPKAITTSSPAVENPTRNRAVPTPIPIAAPGPDRPIEPGALLQELPGPPAASLAAQAKPNSDVPQPVPAAALPAPADSRRSAWLLALLAAVAALAGGLFIRRQRILSRTRSALRVSARLEAPANGFRATPLAFAARPHHPNEP